MTRKECQQVLSVLRGIKNADAHVQEAILNVERDILRFDKRAAENRANRDSGYEFDYPFSR